MMEILSKCVILLSIMTLSFAKMNKSSNSSQSTALRSTSKLPLLSKCPITNLPVSLNASSPQVLSKAAKRLPQKACDSTRNHLPEENESWETLRKNKKVYVDKTFSLEKLLNKGRKLFLITRPERFGKSLFVEMMSSFFRGQKSLFEGTKIYGRGNVVHGEEQKAGIFSWFLKPIRRISTSSNDPWIKYPVIHLDFSNVNPHPPTLEQFHSLVNNNLEKIAEDYGTDITNGTLRLTTLIRNLNSKFNLPVIVLVDEYDEPINYALRTIRNETLAEDIARVLDSLFTQMKDSTEYIRLAFVTGVTKFGGLRTLRDNGLNNFVDLTQDKDFANTFGFTQEEIEMKFKLHTEELAEAKNMTPRKILKSLTAAYNGYRFFALGKVRIFNPRSVLQCFRQQRLDNFWCSSDSLDYIIQRMWEESYSVSAFQNLRHTRNFLFKYRNVFKETIPLEVFMLITGYLKIEQYNEKTDDCILDFANAETKRAISDGIRTYVQSEKKQMHQIRWLTSELRTALANANVTSIVTILNRVGFPVHTAPLNNVGDGDREVSRRFIEVLRTAGVLSDSSKRCSLGNIFPGRDRRKTADIITKHLPVNYIFQVKWECGSSEKGDKKSSVYDITMQRIKRCKPNKNGKRGRRGEFNEALGSQNKVYLMTIDFTRHDGGHVSDWAFLPYEKGKFKFDETQASNMDLRNRIVSSNDKNNN